MANSIKLSGDNYWDTSGLHGGHIFNGLRSVASRTSMTFTVPNTFRGFLFIFLASTSTQGMYMVYSTSGGATYVCPINDTASSITVTSSTNALTVNNQSSGSVFLFYTGNNILETS